jgi:pilus assembly protein Flp/PilA
MNLTTIFSYITARMRLNEKGASLVEYALLVALIAVVCIAAITLLGNNASTKFSRVGASIGGS